MGSFERRLHGIQRKTADPKDRVAANATLNQQLPNRSASRDVPADADGPAAITGRQAAECVSQLVEAAAGTVVTITVNGAGDHSWIEVVWDADGVPSIRQLSTQA
jgi:hypothetical protein